MVLTETRSRSLVGFIGMKVSKSLYWNSSYLSLTKHRFHTLSRQLSYSLQFYRMINAVQDLGHFLSLSVKMLEFDVLVFG